MSKVATFEDTSRMQHVRRASAIHGLQSLVKLGDQIKSIRCCRRESEVQGIYLGRQILIGLDESRKTSIIRTPARDSRPGVRHFGPQMTAVLGQQR
jgi:hypothetical protein